MLIKAIGIDTIASESGPHEINTMAFFYDKESMPRQIIKISLGKYGF